MPYSSSSRGRRRLAFFSLGLLAGLTACGHLGLDLLAVADDGTTLDGDASISDGAAPVDSSTDPPPPATDAATDAGTDEECQGRKCSGTYVSGDTGDDENPGTADKPLKTITKAIAIAKQLGAPTTVRIASRAKGAKYAEKVTLVEGVSLLGGYGCTAIDCQWNWRVQDPTIIADVDYAGVLANDTITRATVLDTLWIIGKGGTPDVAPGAVALTIDGGAPTVRRCRVEGSTVTGGTNGMRRSIGIAIFGPPPQAEPLGPLLVGNTVRSGTATEDSFAILLGRRSAAQNGNACATIVKENDIRSGQGVGSAGIMGWETNPLTLIEGNVVSSGTSTGDELGSWAIVVSKGMTISRNLINGEASSTNGNGATCNGDTLCGGIRSESSSAIITSNIIRGAKAKFAASVFIGAIEGDPGPIVVNGNTLDPVGADADGQTVSAAIVLRNTTEQTHSAVAGKVANNILLGGTNRFRYGVYEDKISERTFHLVLLDNNDFWNPTRQTVDGDFAYRSWDGANPKDYAFDALNTLTTPVPNANLSKDPLLDATFHLKAGSPMVDKGSSDNAPLHDFDGESRPKGKGIDIGADESK